MMNAITTPPGENASFPGPFLTHAIQDRCQLLDLYHIMKSLAKQALSGISQFTEMGPCSCAASNIRSRWHQHVKCTTLDLRLWQGDQTVFGYFAKGHMSGLILNKKAMIAMTTSSSIRVKARGLVMAVFSTGMGFKS